MRRLVTKQLIYQPMKVKHQLFILILILSTQILKSQSVYTELLGRGIFYTINYEHNFSKAVHGWRSQIGMGYLPTSLISVPVSATYVLGRASHHLEIGGGATYFGGYIWGDDDKFNPAINLQALAYYRYEKPGSKFYFKLGIPITIAEIDLGKRFIFTAWPWVGAGIGYNF
jgi:hypothetical protein